MARCGLAGRMVFAVIVIVIGGMNMAVMTVMRCVHDRVGRSGDGYDQPQPGEQGVGDDTQI